MKIVLVLPGATDYSEQRRIQGTLNIPLNTMGEQEIARVGQELADQRVTVVYSSPCAAAVQSAEALADTLDVRCKTLDALQNLNQGLWQGLQIDDIRLKQPKVFRQWQEQPDCVCPPEGESLAEARQRAKTVLAKLSKKHKDEVVVLVAPEPLASLVRAEFAGIELGDLWRAAAEHGCWKLLEEGVSVAAATTVAQLN